ncbi:hypothetical protein TEHAL1_22490 [Tetragenococcus halophilus]|nr:hypothetical protein TEHAL1_22490 [Tetragenococcus halophilus]
MFHAPLVMKYVFNFILREVPIHIINLVTALLPNHYVTNRIKGMLMKPFFGSCGKGLQVGRGVIINNPQNLFLGIIAILLTIVMYKQKAK